MLSAIIAIGSLYVSYISPRPYYIVYNKNGDAIENTAPWTYVIDAIFHMTPFIFVVFNYSAYYLEITESSHHIRETVAVILLLAIYLVSFDIKAMYHLTDIDVQRLVGIGAIIIVAVIGATS